MTQSGLSRNGIDERGGSMAAAGVEAVIRRERRRVRWWAAATAVLWVLAALYLFGLLWGYLMWLHPMVYEFITSEELDPDGVMHPRMMVVTQLLLALLYWPAFLCLAVACTLLFTLASRRATLRQIQVSLADISEQLRRLSEKP